MGYISFDPEVSSNADRALATVPESGGASKNGQEHDNVAIATTVITMGESSNCTNKAGNEEFMMVHNSGKGNSQVSRPKALAMPITLPYQNGFEILAKA
uniref:Uncharacterized protein n=1 Tax=Solanum tuberosum TaxID=4113 RepID=M1A926_SOLTU